MVFGAIVKVQSTLLTSPLSMADFIARLAFFAIAPFVIPWVFGDEFKGAVRPLVLLMPGVVAYAPVTILVVYLTVRRARPRLSLYVSLIGLVVTAATSVVLIPPYGASGAAVASAIGYAAGGLAAWFFFVSLAPRGRDRALVLARRRPR